MVNTPIAVRHCYRECSVVADALAKFERGYNAMVFEPPVEMREIIRDRPPLALPVERQQDRPLQLLPREAPFSLRNPEAYILVQTFPLRPISREECANHGICNSVANSTSATFVCVVGSELIQKQLGDGPKLVRDIFRVVDDLSPGIFPPLSVLAVAAKEAKSPVSTF
ncbi:26S proteasome regulatory subunit 4 -like protein B [Capsicum baccatum]|uniref:26S proteasome regulatory subunit 4-like protein B n=1 Tax=Capsicum baccatum TaxID=33114 RepID=A0A2G2W3P7_CAPBA|nr:26S proteasome regulatory subunit 4 -like protein B [Capsicum baccatum]